MIHGLGGNLLSMNTLTERLVSDSCCVLHFSNRGHDIISRVKKIDNRKKSGKTSFYGGAAHEVFTDCVDDIQGAIEFARSNGAKKIFLIGHSTGCQKITYFLSKKSSLSYITGVILISPLSDFAGSINKMGIATYEQLLKLSITYIQMGTPHTLLPDTLSPEPIDAQRFLSLYTPMSEEEIFSYVDSSRPSLFSKIHYPLLVLFGEHDEFADRPIGDIVSWFDTHHNSIQYQSTIIKGADHGLTDKEKEAIAKITAWEKV
jgi:acetyl esterase/lipase